MLQIREDFDDIKITAIQISVRLMYVDVYTLSKISNWSPYIFMLVLKVRFGYANLMIL